MIHGDPVIIFICMGAFFIVSWRDARLLPELELRRLLEIIFSGLESITSRPRFSIWKWFCNVGKRVHQPTRSEIRTCRSNIP
jgi:hypothetical protein